MEEDTKATGLWTELEKENNIARTIASGFEEMPILSRLEYVFQILSQHVDTDDRVPGQIPMELQVACNVLVQVAEVLRKCPSAAHLTEGLASEFEQTHARRPAVITSSARLSNAHPK